MEREELQLLFAYNRWANDRILTACEKLPADALHAPAALSFRNLFGTLLHIYGAEVVWRKRLQEAVSLDQMPDAASIPGLPALRAAWRAEETAMRDFLETLAPGSPTRKIAFRRTNGDPDSVTLWRALAHVVLHGQQFRAEAGTELTRLGQSPGDLDFIYYLRETGEP